MDTQEQLLAIQEMRNLMKRSSSFISLSGISGIIIGFLALACGCYLLLTVQEVNAQLHTQLAYYDVLLYQGFFNYPLFIKFVVIACGLLLASLAISWGLTARKAKKDGVSMWDETAQRLLINLMLPLIVGGLICIVLSLRGYLQLVAPMMLVFYGMALFNASKFTLGDIRSLGVIEMILGIVALVFPKWSLEVWMVGFGLLHIVYGVVMERKYKGA
jgi:hypothetical protein